MHSAIFEEVSIAPIGIPPPMPFAQHKISGFTPNCSYANNVPVLPAPDCTSSIISNALFCLHNLLIF